MSDKVVLQQKLLTEYKAEVCFRQQGVEEWIVLAHNLVLDVLKDCTNICEGENIVAAFVLNCFICPIIKRKIFHWWHSGRHRVSCICERFSELTKNHIAHIYDESQISSATLFIEEESKSVIYAQPIKEAETCSDE